MYNISRSQTSRKYSLDINVAHLSFWQSSYQRPSNGQFSVISRIVFNNVFVKFISPKHEWGLHYWVGGEHQAHLYQHTLVSLGNCEFIDITKRLSELLPEVEDSG